MSDVGGVSEEPGCFVVLDIILIGRSTREFTLLHCWNAHQAASMHPSWSMWTGLERSFFFIALRNYLDWGGKAHECGWLLRSLMFSVLEEF